MNAILFAAIAMATSVTAQDVIQRSQLASSTCRPCKMRAKHTQEAPASASALLGISTIPTNCAIRNVSSVYHLVPPARL